MIAGSKAKYKGVGEINETGKYGFMLSAIDGDLNGGSESDKFRIKIWDKDNNDEVVYDNQLNDPDDADATFVLGGGSIVIHDNPKTKKANEFVDDSQIVTIPTEFALHQNYPNPFNPETQIRYMLAEERRVSLDIYNIMGEKIRTLINGLMNVGYHSVTWDGRDNFGKQVSGGIYLARIQAGTYTKTIRMLLMK